MAVKSRTGKVTRGRASKAATGTGAPRKGVSRKTVSRKAASKKIASGGEVARLRKKVRLMEIEIGLYRELGDAVGKAGIKTILDRFMDFAVQAAETDSGTLFLIDDKKDEVAFAVVKGPLAKKLKGMRIEMNRGIVGHIAKTGKPYICDDLSKDRKWLGLKGPAPQMNLLGVPLKVRRKVIGVIEVLNKKTGHFTSDDERVLTSLANHLAILLERTGLVKDLDQRVEQFSTLNDVGNLLISTLDEKVVRRRAMEAITGLMDAEAGSLLMVDRAKGELYFDVALGEKGAEMKEVRLRIGEGIAGWVAQKGRAVLIKDVRKDKRFQKGADKKSGFKTRDMVCVPVRIKGRTLAVLQAMNSKSGAFTKDSLKLFQMFSNQVAIAIDNARLYEEIRDTFYATSKALAESIEKRDPYTGGHTKRVLEYSLAIGLELGMDDNMIEKLKLSAVLHDVGKIGVDDSILRKQAPLNDEEFDMMKQHPAMGADIMRHVPQLGDIIPGMLYHHERPDGRGYPEGLKGRKIPLIARIISAADTYDAMTTTRPYRKGLPKEVALAELRKYSGTQFDRSVVKAFIRAFDNGRIDEGLYLQAQSGGPGS